eukprot:55653-Ditylum_brightwellii.AAC.1
MSFHFNKEILDHVLGPAKGEGNEIVPRQTLRSLKIEELNSKTEIRSRNLFDSLIEMRWGTYMNPPPETTPDNWDPYDEYEDDDEKA